VHSKPFTNAAIVNMPPETPLDDATRIREIHDELWLAEIEKEMKEYNEKFQNRRTVEGPGQLVWRYFAKDGGVSPTITGPHTVLRRVTRSDGSDSSNSWVVTKYSPSNDEELKVPEAQLHPVRSAEDLRVGLPPQL